MNTTTAPVSLREHVVPVEAGAHVVGAHWLKATLALALADGRVLRWTDGVLDSAEVHAGGILCTCSDGERLITGGDDGRVVATAADGTSTEIARDEKRRWVDGVALSASGSIAWNTAKTVHARDDKGKIRSLDVGTTPQGLVFAPKGFRLAIGQMNGVSLWYPATETKPEFLEWKGAHLDVVWSPDGRFVVSSMPENALHGWRLGEKPSHMRMTGYPAKPRSLSWSHDGLWLASSGADAAIVWPFQGEGPQGSNTLTLSGRVYVAEQLGDSILVTVQAGDATIQAMTPPDRHFAIDQPVDLAIPDEALYIFEGPGKMTGRHGKSRQQPRCSMSGRLPVTWQP